MKVIHVITNQLSLRRAALRFFCQAWLLSGVSAASHLCRGLNIITAQFMTRMDVVFEDVLVNTPNLNVISDEPALADGWFRLIEPQKKAE